MIVMPSNQTGFWCGYLAHKYESARVGLGHLFSPGGELGRGPVMRYALDNGAFGCWERGVAFEQPVAIKQSRHKPPKMQSGLGAWRKLLEWAYKAAPEPLWCLVPDVVGDRDATLRAWDTYAPEAAACGWPLAFAAQDGMTFGDVPAEAAVVFIGGSDEFKAAALFPWCARFRCHVGRVTALDHLRLCLRAGAKSCDATGHFRTDRQRRNLEIFLAEANGERPAPAAPLSWLSASADDETALPSRSTSTGERALIGAERPRTACDTLQASAALRKVAR